MNQTHVHLLITHLPIFASLLGGLVLAYGLWTKSQQTNRAAYFIFILAAMGAGIAYLTGEAAEETVENIQGVAKNMIEEHEEFAVFALVSCIALGVASLGGLLVPSRKSSISNTIAAVILCLALISFSLVARTGYLGGQIRHTEINSSMANIQGQDSQGEDDD